MHIILGDQITAELADKYIVLELDSFEVTGRDGTVSAFCLVENVPLQELPQADQFRDLHAQMIRNFRAGNWKFCEDALEHLMGRWNGEVDSFYKDLQTRLLDLQAQTLTQEWNPALKIS
jgi:hypothetical protein